MTDIKSSTSLADTPKTDSNPHSYSPDPAAESPSVETEDQSPTWIDEQATVPIEMMQAEPSHGEPEQTEAERSSTTSPSMTQADAPADVPAEAAAEPAPLKPDNASSDDLDAQEAWDTGFATELAAAAQPELPVSERLSASRDNEQVGPAHDSMSATEFQSKPEQTPTEPQPTPKPLLTRADAGVDIVPEALVPPADSPAPQEEGVNLASLLAPKKVDSQAKVMVSMVSETADLFHTPRGDAYITFHDNGIDKTQKVNCKETILLISSLVYRATEMVPSPSSLKTAIRTLEGKAMFEGPEIKVHLRYAFHEECLYIDLCNDRREQIKITKDRYYILQAKDSPVKFRKEEGMAAMCHPADKGSFKPLLEILNLEDEIDSKLTIGWLVGAMNPKGPFPILVLLGEQGASKSTTAKILQSLIDPSFIALVPLPSSTRNLAIAASKTWVLPFDNCSKISNRKSDSLCMVSTGGNYRTRTNYANTQETILSFKNPMLMNGIENFIERQDLADRCIFINQRPIPKHKRLPERELWRRWEAAKPIVLAALCEALSASLRNIDNVRLPEYPRMADFLQFVTAAESALPWNEGEFYEAYQENIKRVIDDALESDDVATAVMSMMEKVKGAEWEGTATDLKAILDTIVDDQIRRSKEWPKRPNMLSRHLQRCGGFLGTKGIVFEKGKSGNRYISLRKYAEDTLKAGQAPKQQAAMATAVGEEEYDL